MDARYVYQNGMLIDTQAPTPIVNVQANSSSSSAQPVQPLVFPSTPQDIIYFQEAMGKHMQVANNAMASIQQFQHADYAQKLYTDDRNGIMANISNFFSKHSVPIGMSSKLLGLTKFKQLHFIVDDSGSMVNNSDTKFKTASEYIKKRGNKHDYMTRWQEAEDRLHKLIDVLAYIPTSIKITFLNRKIEIDLSHIQNCDPETFKVKAHQAVQDAFKKLPKETHLTPIYKALNKAFNTQDPKMVYLLTDGVPSHKGLHAKAAVEEVKNIIIARGNGHPENLPFTILSCTNNEADLAWAKGLDEIKNLFIAELDDLLSEAKEVIAKQGPGFSFTEGMWLICMLVAAINPEDLDALDENRPLTKKTLSEIFGRIVTSEEYSYYFNYHPRAKKLQDLYSYYNSDVNVSYYFDHKELRRMLQQLPPPGWTGMQGGPQMFPPPQPQQQVQNQNQAQQVYQYPSTPTPYSNNN